MSPDKETTRNSKSIAYEEQLKFLSPISKPLASRKATKHALKLVRKASKERAVKRGIKEVVKALNRDTEGVCIIAGDINPIDVIAHIPVLCEQHRLRYIFIPSKEFLGAASLTRRPTSCVLVTYPKDDSTYKVDYDEFMVEITTIWDSYKRDQ